MKKTSINVNQVVELEITGLSHRGEGIGRYEGIAVFVPYCLPQEKVQVEITEVKKNFARGKKVKLLSPNVNRIDPLCNAFESCGGCQYQHGQYAEQLEWKQKLVEDSLVRIGKLTGVSVLSTIGMDNPWNYRNKVHFQVGEKEGRLILGFFAEESHDVVEVEGCSLVDQELLAIAKAVEELLNKYEVKPFNWQTKDGQLRHVILRRGHFTGEIMLILVTSDAEFSQGVQIAKELMNKESKVISVIKNINTAPSRIVLGQDFLVLGGRGQAWERLGHLTFAISPGAFFQVNPQQTLKLYEKAMEYASLTKQETVLDLYCGVGTISLYLAQRAKKVIGIEIVPEAVIDAKRNTELNKIRNAQFLSGKVEELLPKLAAKGVRADVIVVDPPRKGCEKSALDAMVEMGPERIVYVSCDPGTLARDLGYLAEKGYETKEVQPVDMFPQTAHVECVGLVVRGGVE